MSEKNLVKFYYTIKGAGRRHPESYPEWQWPPVFSGCVEAPNRAQAKKQIEEEYGRQFPMRVLVKDIQENSYLLHITEIDDKDSYLLERFELKTCCICGTTYRMIDKYNDPHSAFVNKDYCSRACQCDGQAQERARQVDLHQFLRNGKIPAVIYQVRQKSTGLVYVGQSVQPFTLRWWQHLTAMSECKFHQALRQAPLSDWEFSVLETINTAGMKSEQIKAHLNDREKHWIAKLNSVVNGLNSVGPVDEGDMELAIAVEASND